MSLGHFVTYPHNLFDPSSTRPPASLFSFNINLCIYLFIYLSWLRWVFVDACGLSLLAASGGYSSLWCACLSLRWLLLRSTTGSLLLPALHSSLSCYSSLPLARLVFPQIYRGFLLLTPWLIIISSDTLCTDTLCTIVCHSFSWLTKFLNLCTYHYSKIASDSKYICLFHLFVCWPSSHLLDQKLCESRKPLCYIPLCIH